MNDITSDLDDENRPFDFEKSRAWRPGDPKSSEIALLHTQLRKIIAAADRGDIEACKQLARAGLYLRAD
jgi:hypothetical protein